jgi:flagellar basal-body rod protein FlgG
MMRALWTAGSGMIAQQFNVDVISNNLANTNTTSFKKQKAEFKDILYQTLEHASLLNGQGKPINLQVGLGTRVVGTDADFSTGNMEPTGGVLDFAIDGDGFFAVAGPKGQIVYTRDGSFKLSPTDAGKKLTTNDGYPVLDETGNEIILDISDESRLSFSNSGEISYPDETGVMVSLGQSIGMYTIPNKTGLENIGNNFYSTNSASGEATSNADSGQTSVLLSQTLESSNVQVVEEMVKLIVAQRAYEVNSKAIQSADEMLSQANNLKR